MTRYAAVVTAVAASVLLAAATHAAPLSYEASVLDDNPYAYYRFGETSGTVAADSSGNNRNAVYTDSPTLGTVGYGTASDTAVSLDTSWLC